jgi:hypothetical protein
MVVVVTKRRVRWMALLTLAVVVAGWIVYRDFAGERRAVRWNDDAWLWLEG